jgi:hypothetical protein
MNVSPVVAIHIPFGGDNHHDPMYAAEGAQTIAGVATLDYLLGQLKTYGLTDAVSIISLNVFGRTLVYDPKNGDGRQHNPNHQVSFAIGKPFHGGIYGAVAQLPANKGGDFGALPISSTTGAGEASGDIQPVDTLAAFGITVSTASSGTDLTQPVVSFKTDVMVIFNDNCGSSTCHGTTMSPSGALFLGALSATGGDASAVYAALVGPKSGELLSMPFVTPGDPSKSYLMHKVDGDQCHFDAECVGQSCLAAMPNGGQTMPVSRRDTVRRWIAQGAKDN